MGAARVGFTCEVLRPGGAAVHPLCRCCCCCRSTTGFNQAVYDAVANVMRWDIPLMAFLLPQVRHARQAVPIGFRLRGSLVGDMAWRFL